MDSKYLAPPAVNGAWTSGSEDERSSFLESDSDSAFDDYQDAEEHFNEDPWELIKSLRAEVREANSARDAAYRSARKLKTEINVLQFKLDLRKKTDSSLVAKLHFRLDHEVKLRKAQDELLAGLAEKGDSTNLEQLRRALEIRKKNEQLEKDKTALEKSLRERLVETTTLRHRISALTVKVQDKKKILETVRRHKSREHDQLVAARERILELEDALATKAERPPKPVSSPDSSLKTRIGDEADDKTKGRMRALEEEATVWKAQATEQRARVDTLLGQVKDMENVALQATQTAKKLQDQDALIRRLEDELKHATEERERLIWSGYSHPFAIKLGGEI